MIPYVSIRQCKGIEVGQPTDQSIRRLKTAPLILCSCYCSLNRFLNWLDHNSCNQESGGWLKCSLGCYTTHPSSTHGTGKKQAHVNKEGDRWLALEKALLLCVILLRVPNQDEHMETKTLWKLGICFLKHALGHCCPHGAIICRYSFMSFLSLLFVQGMIVFPSLCRNCWS